VKVHTHYMSHMGKEPKWGTPVVQAGKWGKLKEKAVSRAFLIPCFRWLYFK